MFVGGGVRKFSVYLMGESDGTGWTLFPPLAEQV